MVNHGALQRLVLTTTRSLDTVEVSTVAIIESAWEEYPMISVIYEKINVSHFWEKEPDILCHIQCRAFQF